MDKFMEREAELMYLFKGLNLDAHKALARAIGSLDKAGVEAILNESGKPADEVAAFLAKFDAYKAHAKRERGE